MNQATNLAQQLPIITVPRISIHALCESQSVAEVIQLAAVDRRMSKAHLTIQLGGISAAAHLYQQQSTPNLLIVESSANREGMLAELSQLAMVCEPTTKVIVIGHLNDVVLYRELVRQGISEYLIFPFTQLQLIETISNLYNDPNSLPLGRIYSFVSAKGGVGSSTIAHNVAWLMSSKLHLETVITDLDLSFGTAGLNFNQDGGGGILDALTQPERVDSTLLDRLLTNIGDKLSLLSGPCGVDRDASIEEHSIETILNTMRYGVPNIILDVPNIWAPWVKHTLINSDEIIITATPELACLRNTKNLVDLLKSVRANDKLPRLVINQVGIPKRPEIPVAEFAKAVGLTPSIIIPSDPQNFGASLSNGKMVCEVAPKSKAAEALVDLSNLLAGRDVLDRSKKPKSSISQLLSGLRKK